jgi:hypothetical protein
MTLYIGDTPEQLGSCLTADAMMIDGKVATKDDYLALVAQVEVLRIAALNAVQTMSGGKAKADLRDAYDATPEQCLREIQANSINDAATYLSESIPDKSYESVIFKDRYVYLSTRYLREHANRIRQGEKQ